ALQITTSQLPSGILSKSYGATLSASGGTTPYAWSLASGSLPAGLTLSSAGTISGTPTSAGSFPFTVQVTDTASHSASANLSVNVGNPVVSVAIASPRSEEHTSELQSRSDLVCRLLLEKKKPTHRAAHI